MTPNDAVIRDALLRAVAESKSPGAAACVGGPGTVHFLGAAGNRRVTPRAEPASADTVFDLASLTKVVATTTAVMMLVEDGVIGLDQPLGEVVPLPVFNGFRFRHLLTHTAGLAPAFAYYKQHNTMTEMVHRFADAAVRNEAGVSRVYSDVGFMLLGFAVELAAKDTLDNFCRRRIFEPLAMNDTRFNPPAEWAERCAPTEDCAWRQSIVHGVVHDENAFAVGGVSGHAGLFSTAGDLGKFCDGLMGGSLLRSDTLDEMTRLGQVPFYPWQGLGWLLDPWTDDSMGYLPSRRAMGHTGWTGTTMWMDRDTGLYAILLGNTCHPSRTQRSNRTFRSTFYSAVANAAYPAGQAVHTGLDRLVRDGFDAIANKRIAVLTNAAAVDMLGRSILGVLPLAKSASIAAYYGPEHGLQGQAEAGEKVASQGGATPIISLYGDKRTPLADELKGLDAFVIDLPDIGARYYTYIATMKDCLEVCAAANCPVIVLDRPNPLGGDIVEGPIAENTNSFVCCAPIPVRHGMTLGELALHFASTMRPAPKIEVVRLDNWKRRFLFDQCALPWAPPSPNIPTAESALAYVGTCLFEGTNLNEGRGTETPFTVFGAPWLDPDAVLRRLPAEAALGCRLNPTAYTPVAIPGKATSPRYKDTACRGIRITEMDGTAFRPFTLGLALIEAIRAEHGAQFETTDFFDTLVGNKTLRSRLMAGASALELVESYRPATERFRAARKLLY